MLNIMGSQNGKFEKEYDDGFMEQIDVILPLGLVHLLKFRLNISADIWLV